MRLAKLLLPFILCLPSAVAASGFGWYVSVIPWDDFNKYVVEGSARTARELVAAPGTTNQVKQYVQDRLEEEIYSKYCNAQGLHGTDLSPRFAEFYSLRFLKYGENLQRGRGVERSLFYRFLGPHKPYISIAPKGGNPYFILSPEETETAHAEIRKMNAEVVHPPDLLPLARHLEGVLLLIASDRYPSTNSPLTDRMKSAAFLCGHD